jgi:hypothetical protein
MAKQCISIVASEETYMNLKPFEDIKQLNKAVRTYKEQYQGELSKTAVSVLDILHRYAAKFTGVSFLTKNNIASMLGKSQKNHYSSMPTIRAAGHHPSIRNET